MYEATLRAKSVYTDAFITVHELLVGVEHLNTFMTMQLILLHFI